MKTSVIRHRVADFLRRYPPFDSLPEDDLFALASSGRVHFFESESYVFQQGKPPKGTVWVIQQGAVELWDERDGEPRQIDLLGAGDMLELDRYFGAGVYSASARTASDVILYSIDEALFGDLMRRVPGVASFVAAHTDAQARPTTLPTWVQAPVDCPLPIDDRALPEAPDGQTAGAYFLEMLRRGTDCLRLAPSGRSLTVVKLALFAGQNPFQLAAEMEAAAGPEHWSPLLRLADRITLAGLDVHHAARVSAPIATHIHSAFLRAAIRAHEAPAARHVWIAFGRAAREEMLPQRRARLGIVHEGDDAGFRAWLERVRNTYGECGLPEPRDIGDVVPPTATLADWTESLVLPVRDPIGHSLYSARMMLDMRPVAGDHAIFERLKDAIETELHGHDAWLAVLANDTLSRLPPLAFFGDLVVDLDGARRESLDLFAVGVQPIVDAARVLALAQRKLTPVRTVDRLDAAQPAYPDAEGIFRDAVSAFEVALYYQARAKWRHASHAARVRPADFSRYDQRVLKTAFQAIQRLLEWTAERFVR
jgi:signal-transduction protein with cAMP-binding, CBS, and nucleotidyltransferase domain